MAEQITDAMIERAAVRLAFQAAGDEGQWRAYWDFAKSALSAALAGCTPVEVPAPHQVREDATIWLAEARRIAASVDGTGRPFVLLDSQLWLVTEAEAVGAALVAAAREARRLSGGPQVGDQHG